LYKKHESFATNPRIARAMYQVKYIETIGTGLTDLLEECRKKGLKTPLLEEMSGRFRIVIWRPQPTADTVGNRPESSQKTPQKILASIRANPFVGTQAMADMIGEERSTVARAIAKLKRDGVLRRIGPDKGGHWEVIEKLDE